MKILEAVAFELHEQWREKFKKEDNTYQPKWINIKSLESCGYSVSNLPSFIRFDETNGYQFDLANAYFTQLMPSQKKDLTEVALDTINVFRKFNNSTVDDIGDKLHKLNLHNKNSMYSKVVSNVPYAELPDEQKNFYLTNYSVVRIMLEAQEICRPFPNLEALVEFFKDIDRQCKNFYTKYDKTLIFSHFDNYEKSYFKVNGKTINESENTQDKTC